jgi:predicted DNA-binding protein (MmcQ/YjbR family)
LARSRTSVDRWDRARAFALSLPAAEEDGPWGQTAIKVRRKPGVPPWRKDGEGVYGPMFLWLGHREAETPTASVKLTASYDAAVALAAATPTTMSGLGQWGWLTVPFDRPVDLPLLCDWVEESYRNVAPRRCVVELDARHLPT